MSWLEKDYHTIVILGEICEKVLWDYENWKNICETLYQYTTNNTPDLFSVRVEQISRVNQKKIRFGRLLLDDKSNQKWTHKSPITKELSKEWFFSGLEIWSPNWNKCEEINTSPDIFFSIHNNCLLDNKNLQFNPVLTIALNTKVFTDDVCRKLIISLKEFVPSELILYTKKKWALPCGSGFINSIQDLPLNGLFKGRYQSDQKPEKSKFIDIWNIIE